MFRIAKTPRGLIELFRVRNSGSMPPNFGDVIQPTVETRDFYASDLYIPASAAPVVGAITGSLTASLTYTAALGVRSVGGALTVGAAAVTQVACTWGLQLAGFAANTFIPLGSMFYPNIAAGATVHFGSGPFPFVAPAGTVQICQCTGLGAGADHTVQVRGLLEFFQLP